jgi:DNA-binding LytR/AlgR family response regulator
MSILGWRAIYSNQEASRRGNWEHLPAGNVAHPEAAEPRSVSVLESVITPGTPPAKYLHRMTVRAGDKIVLVPMCDVLWIQSHRNLLQLHLQTANYEHRMTITDMYERLDPEHFLRVHRSVIVNLDYVVEFDLPRHGNAFVHLRNGKALPISRTARLVLRRGLLSQTYAAAGEI